MKTNSRKHLVTVLRWALTAIVALVILIPLYWIFISSIQPSKELISTPIHWIPRAVTLENYRTLFIKIGLGGMVWNTLIITGITILVLALLCSIAAYAFERYHSRGLSTAYGLIVFSSLIPAIVTARPLYDYFGKLGLVDTHTGLILLYTSAFIPFTILILRNFISGIPISIEEAAEIDGANYRQKLQYVIFPLMRPGLATACIINFILCLNEFFIPLFFTQHIRVLTMGIATLPRANSYDVPWDLMSAMGCIILIPIVLFVVLFEDNIMDGIMAGGVKA